MSAPAQRSPQVIDLGRVSYADAYQLQLAHHEEVVAARESTEPRSSPDPGRLLLVEHDPPVITISRRRDARRHLVASPEMLIRAGVTIAETDRGGDITYHGPGQLVVYPILDLNHYRLGLHAYMRLLEQSVINALGTWNITGVRENGSTGVWVAPQPPVVPEIAHHSDAPAIGSSKIAAMGVRVRRWVSMHGLALNVITDLEHFNLIIPCGLAGRAVTSVRAECERRTPPATVLDMTEVKRVLARCLIAELHAASLKTAIA